MNFKVKESNKTKMFDFNFPQSLDKNKIISDGRIKIDGIF